jgi:hypothetical protein
VKYSYGLPVVATTVGARGLARRDLPNLFITDHPETFAETVLSLLAGRLTVQAAPAGVACLPPGEHLQRFLRICHEIGVRNLPTAPPQWQSLRQAAAAD